MVESKDEKLAAMRHSAEHVLEQAMVRLYPGLKMAMGPATDEGFYFDFDYEGKISEEDFAKIEAEMKKIIKEDLAFRREELETKKARKLFDGNEYKQEWLDEIEERGQKATVYWTGKEFVDLCAGPHVESTGKIGTVKLLSVAGAYWRGDEKNKMLTRVYGTAFATEKEMDEYLKRLEEIKKRDHKILGPQLELFMFHETAPGSPYWLDRGLIIYNELLNFWREEHRVRGYQEVATPLVNKKELWEISGHWEHFKEDMFIANMGENEIYGIKPMNCPNAMLIFGARNRSYRELPLRLSDSDTLHRYERSGTLNGLLRVRSFRQDDSHNFVTEEQVESEYDEILNIVERFYGVFHLDYKLRLGTRPKKFLGKIEAWNKAEASLRRILQKRVGEGNYEILEGDGAFYGPKIDIVMKDALSRDWQLGTVQLDFQLPQRFKLKYVDKNGQEKVPVVIHRVIYGSLERFIGILIEHYAGAFPVWLAPLQVKVIPITDKQSAYGREVEKTLITEGVRVGVDERSETMQAKIRQAQMEKVPYMLVVGEREAKNKTVAVRTREGEDRGEMKLAKFAQEIKKVIEAKQVKLA